MCFFRQQSNTNKAMLIFASVIFLALIIMGFIYIFCEQENIDRTPFIENSDELIGGAKDEGGCLIAAGYSWCERKNKCLRTWEEPCLTLDEQSMVEQYLRNNISQLSPTKEVLGGKFYITQVSFTGNDRVAVDYEDGHIALRAEVVFTITNGQVTVKTFNLLNDDSSAAGYGNTNFAVEDLTRLFSEKYNIAPANIILQITDDRGAYVRGGVKLSSDVNATGGYFLAKMVDGQYQIVVDGNGQISCALVKDFPKDMIDDCVGPSN